MRKLFLAVMVVLIGVVLVACEKKKGTGLQVAWMTSFDEALKIAREKNKPVMIDFYADWCGWCHRLDSDTYSSGEVVNKSKDFVNLKIDADAERDLVQRYRITGLPTILFIDGTGREIHRIVGYKAPDAFSKEMEIALRNFRNEVGG